MKEIIEFLNKDVIITASWNNERIKTPFDITPSEFLEFAEKDLKEKTKKCRVNALSNLKRAIDCQLDSLLVLLGHYNIAKKEYWNFPKKVKFISSIGLIAPRIIERINSKRNLLEHEYKNPNLAEVEDALDIATLFIAYTDGFLNKSYGDFEVLLESAENSERDINEKKPWLSFEFINNKCIFNLNLHGYPKEEESKMYKISRKDEHFLWLLKKYIEFIREN